MLGFLKFIFSKTKIFIHKKNVFLLICTLRPRGEGAKGLSGHVR